MKNTIAVSAAVIMTAFVVSSACAQGGAQPSKVTGGGRFLDIGADGISGSGQLFSFTITVNPDKKTAKKSPQAVIHADGQAVRDYWGGPLVLKGDFTYCNSFGDLFEPNDPKPPQAFLFLVEHSDPNIGDVNVWVFAHDPELSGSPDWFGIWIEPSGGNGWPNGSPFPNDDLLTLMGVVVNGNIMDHRK